MLQFPIKLEAPGLIKVLAEVKGGRAKSEKHPYTVSIVEAAGVDASKKEGVKSRKYIKAAKAFEKEVSISYAVDANDLARTHGKYVIFLSNHGKVAHGVGTLVISYPVRTTGRDSAGDRISEPVSSRPRTPRQRD